MDNNKLPETKEEILEFQKMIETNRKHLGRSRAKKYGKAVLAYMMEIQADSMSTNLKQTIDTVEISFTPEDTHEKRMKFYLDIANEAFKDNPVVDIDETRYDKIYDKLFDLVKDGANLNIFYNADGVILNPLRLALGYEKLTKLYLIAGANPNFFDKFSGESMLMEAATLKFEKDVKLLLEFGADVNYENAFRERAIHLLCEEFEFDSHGEILEMLLSAGADPNAQNDVGDTALHFIADSWEEDARGIELMHKYGANPNIKNSLYMTPLMLSASRDNMPKVKALIEMNPNPEITSYKGNTALELAKTTEVAKVISDYEELWVFTRPRKNAEIETDDEGHAK